jgi:hypothetical protein
MAKYLIERRIPGAGKLTPAELKAISFQSNGVLSTMDDRVKWLHSYVLDDQIFCVYESESIALIEDHARCLGVPANVISEIHGVISPATAEGA